MARSPSVFLLAAFAVATPWIAAAQPPRAGGPWQPPQSQPGYREGFVRGEQAGLEDSRRAEAFQFTDEGEYRRGDVGYRALYGNREWYTADFRYGFEVGYRQGYQANRGRTSRERFNGQPSMAGRGTARFDLAHDTGYNDGYEAGLSDAAAGRRPQPLTERRYRNADHGYERWYGSEESYRINYRSAFKLGYERAYRDQVRYR
jgi:hypothetical protein